MEDLLILQKSYDMVLYGLICLRQFPKSERYGLAEDIRQCMYHFLQLIVTANKRYYKRNTLQDLDIELEKLRILKWAIYRQLNPLLDRQFISGSYGCRIGKGAQNAAKRLQYWMRTADRKPVSGSARPVCKACIKTALLYPIYG